MFFQPQTDKPFSAAEIKWFSQSVKKSMPTKGR
jgi:hypothetical protein